MSGLLARHTSTAVALVILCGLAVFGYALVRSQQEVNRGRKAAIALCALRADVDQRIASSEAFLKRYPQGVDGITAALVQQSLTNSRRTRLALAVLDCKE